MTQLKFHMADISLLNAAKTKQQLFDAASIIAEAGRSVADPAILADVVVKLRGAAANAERAPDFAVPFSAKLIALMVRAMSHRRCPYVMLGAHAYTTFIGDPQAHCYLDLVTKHENLMAGEIAVMFGMTIYTDAYYPFDLRVLGADCMYVMDENCEYGYAVRII